MSAYARAQPWPKHDRPTRWVLEVARQKLLELKQHCEARQAMGDSKFAEALELMAFLANLVGIQNIQRFIPLADPEKDGTGAAATATMEAPTIIKPVARPATPPEEPTREMPRLKPAVSKAAPTSSTPKAPPPASATPKPSATSKANAAPAKLQPARTASTASRAASRSGTPRADASKTLSADMKSKIMADAVRLIKWGKPWHELAELIGRIAERPPVPEIRKVLRAHRAEIEAKAKAAQSR